MKKINYGKHTIDESDIESVVSALKSENLTQGPLIESFERALGEKFCAKYVCATSNGTAALHLSGIALGWSEGDIVITTALTFIASINSILYCNATPDLVDIDLKTYCINLDSLENKLKKYQMIGKKVSAVIAVDFAGQPCQWEELSKLSEKYDFKLINDNCHAIGASYKNDLGYGVKFADIVTHSYHPVKNITTGEGGAILTNDKKIFDKVKLLRSHNIDRECNKTKNQGAWHYDVTQLGYNYRLNDLQCALGISQLKRLDRFVKSRNDIADIYRDHFKDCDKYILPNQNDYSDHAYHLFPIRINFLETKIQRTSLFEKMKELGINLQVHYIPIYKHHYIKDKYIFDMVEFPNTEIYYQQTVSLPIYPTLTLEQQLYVIECLKKVT